MDAALFGGLSSVIKNVVKGLFTQTSGSFIPSITGWYEVTVHGGGGGSGGVYSSNPFNIVRSGGGGAGEQVTMLHWLTAGTTYNFTVGAGGTAGTAAPTAGGTGGSSIFNGPIITQTALGGNGSASPSTIGPAEGIGAAGGRKDGITAAGSNRAQLAWSPEAWGGACGGTSNGVAGGSSSVFVGITSTGRGGSGACSSIAQGGGGATALGIGSAGTYGAGAGGSWTNTNPGQTGAAGGLGWIRIIQLSAS